MSRPPAHRLALVVGGARSGKSALAERLLEASEGPLLYLATGSRLAVDGTSDPDMAARIAAHIERRDPRYTTVECGADLAAGLRAAPPLPALVDSLGTWVAASYDAHLDDYTCDVDDLCAALAGRIADVVVVSDEVGMGVHPPTPAARRFRDLVGEANRRVAELADDVFLASAGRAVRLEPFEHLPRTGP